MPLIYTNTMGEKYLMATELAKLNRNHLYAVVASETVSWDVLFSGSGNNGGNTQLSSNRNANRTAPK